MLMILSQYFAASMNGSICPEVSISARSFCELTVINYIAKDIFEGEVISMLLSGAEPVDPLDFGLRNARRSPI